MKNHPFHLVDKSPWPIMGSIGSMTITSGTVMWFNKNNPMLMMLGTIIILLTMTQWWRDTIREATFQGMHTSKVIKSMKMGMILFITSEVMLFMSMFWAFFHSSLSPNIEIGLQWPPMNIKSLNPMNIPLLNTMVLLSSGMSITWAHNALINKNYSQTIQSLTITIMLGLYFSLLQAMEYYEATFSIADSIYGSTFFLTTGLHGIHVIIGTLFILVSTMRIMKLQLSNKHHLGFEASAWYWHFVDVVWLFLYLSIYWWGN